MSVLFRRSPRYHRGVWATTLLAMALVACSDNPTKPDEPDVDETSLRRLLISDQTNPAAVLVDIDSAKVIRTLSLGQQTSTLYSSPSRRFGMIHEGTTGKVFVVDGGVWAEEHGDHAHLHRSSPGFHTFSLTGNQPVHGFGGNGTLAVFFDGDGSAAFFTDEGLHHGTPPVRTIQTGTAHHGNALAMGGSYFVTNGVIATGSTLPNGVNRYDLSGALQEDFENCPGLHGDAATATTAAWGCSDGVLLVRQTGAGFTAEKVTLTGELAGLGVGLLQARDDLDYYLLRVTQGSARRLAKMNAANGAVTPIALPGTYPLAWDIDADGRRLVVLDETGHVYVVSMTTLAVERTVSAVVAPIPTDQRAAAPTIAAGDGVAYVTSPKTGEVLELDLDAGVITRRITVGGAPGKVVLLGVIRDNVHFEGH